MNLVDTFLKKRMKPERDALAAQARALSQKESDIDKEVNRRVAATLAQMDPFEPLLREFHGIFSEEFERVEDQLDAKGQLMMRQWAFQNAETPAFKYLTEWVMNMQANETLKRAPVTTERVLYGRAQISAMILFVKEVKRLSEGYKDMLKQGKTEDFDESDPVE